MRLFIISNDPIQKHVLTEVAKRTGWDIPTASSFAELGPARHQLDALVFDVGFPGRAERAHVQRLAADIGRERIFLLAEQIAGILPTPEELGVKRMAIKPVHPAQFLRLIQESVPMAPRLTDIGHTTTWPQSGTRNPEKAYGAERRGALVPQSER